MVKRRLGSPIFPLLGPQRQPRPFGLFLFGAAAIDAVPVFGLAEAAPVQVPASGSLYPSELATPALEQLHALTELLSHLYKAPFLHQIVFLKSRVGDSALSHAAVPSVRWKRQPEPLGLFAFDCHCCHISILSFLRYRSLPRSNSFTVAAFGFAGQSATTDFATLQFPKMSRWLLPSPLGWAFAAFSTRFQFSCLSKPLRRKSQASGSFYPAEPGGPTLDQNTAGGLLALLFCAESDGGF